MVEKVGGEKESGKGRSEGDTEGERGRAEDMR